MFEKIQVCTKNTTDYNLNEIIKLDNDDAINK